MTMCMWPIRADVQIKCVSLRSWSLIYEISHTSSLMFCFSNLLWSGLPVRGPWLFSCPKPWLDCSTWGKHYPPGSAIQSSPWSRIHQAWCHQWAYPRLVVGGQAVDQAFWTELCSDHTHTHQHPSGLQFLWEKKSIINLKNIQNFKKNSFRWHKRKVKKYC